MTIVNKNILLLAVSFILGIIILICLHLTGNMLDYKATGKIQQAFERQNLSSNPYNGNKSEYQTPKALLGIDVYPDCQIYLSIITPKKCSIEEAILPPMLNTTPLGEPCETLENIVLKENHPTVGYLKTRYWWGSKAFASIFLYFFSLFQTVQLLKVTTFFMYVLICLSIQRISSDFLYIISPVLIYGFFFSGIIYFGGISLSLPYLWTLICTEVLLILAINKSYYKTYYFFFLFSGIGSSFIFQLAGHLVFLIPLFVIFSYFIILTQHSLVNRYKIIFCYLTIYTIGFSGGILSDQILSMIYLNSDEVFNRFSDQLILRLSNSYPDYLTNNIQHFGVKNIINKLFTHYYLVGAYASKNIYWFLLSGIGAFIVSLCSAFFLSCQKKNIDPLLKLIPFVFAITIFFMRFILLKNHSAVHVHLLGRYMFIPLSLSWSMLLSVYFSYKKNYSISVKDNNNKLCRLN